MIRYEIGHRWKCIHTSIVKHHVMFDLSKLSKRHGHNEMVLMNSDYKEKTKDTFLLVRIFILNTLYTVTLND